MAITVMGKAVTDMAGAVTAMGTVMATDMNPTMIMTRIRLQKTMHDGDESRVSVCSSKKIPLNQL